MIVERPAYRVAVAGALALGMLAAPGAAPLVSAATAPCEIEGIERIVAVGDVHGAYQQLVQRILGRFGGKVWQIDTGMQPAYVPTGRASALDIQGGTLTAIYADRREVLEDRPAAPGGRAP